MADTKDPSGGSFIKAALTGAPLAVGAGVTVKNIIREGAHIPAYEGGLDRALRATRAISGDLRRIRLDKHLEFMNSNIDPRIARRSWMWAMESVDPLTRDSLLTFTRDISSLPPEDVVSSIEHTLRRNESQLVENVFRRFRTNVKALQVQSEILGAGIPEYVELTGRNLSQNIKTTMPESIQRGLAVIEQATGATAVPRGLTRKEWATEGLGVWNVTMQGAGVGDFTLRIPQEAGGMLVQGGSMQTRRIAPGVAIFDPATGKIEKLSRTEFFMREVSESIVPDIGGRLKTPYDVQRAIQQAEQRIFGTLETTPNVPGLARSAAQVEYELTRSQAFDIMVKGERELYAGAPQYMSTYRLPSEKEIGDAMLAGKFRGGIAPDAMARGRVSAFEWEKYSITPGAIEYGRRPEQIIRKFQLTQDSLARLASHDAERYARYRLYESEGERMAASMSIRPNLKTLYVDPKQHAATLKALEMGEGEALARKSLGGLLAFEELKTQKLIEVRADLLESQFKKPLVVGEVIGRTETGAPFIYKEGMNIIGGIEHKSPGVGNYISLQFMQESRFRHGDKLFGAAKAVALMRDEQSFYRGARKITHNSEMLRNLEIIANMDELKKNRSLHNRQIISALGEILASRRGAPTLNAPTTAAQMAFMESPATFARRWDRLATRGGVYRHKEFIGQAMKFAVSEIAVTPREFGAAFGAVPYVTEARIAATMAREAMPTMGARGLGTYLREMFRGTAGGAMAFTYGGPAALTGAGAMGSLEPRAFDIMQTAAWKTVGGDIPEEMIQRLAYTNPEQLAVHRELTRTLESFVGKVTPAVGAREYAPWATGGVFEAKRFESFVTEGGGWIKPGKGLPSIYVPGAAAMRALRPFETAGDTAVFTDLFNTYSDIAVTSSMMYEAPGGLSADEARKRMRTYANLIRKEWAPAGKGLGAITRGKVLGSRFLRGVSTTAAGAETAIQGAMVVGLSERTFTQMMEEMVESGLYDPDRLTAISEMFKAGDEVGGVLARHPFIGPFSMLPMRFKRVEGVAADQILLPELLAGVRARTANKKLTDYTIKLGPMVGMAGDKDADIYSAMLLGPDNESIIRKATMQTDHEFLHRYTEHQVRMQMFKASTAGAGAEMTTVAQMIAETQKLGTGQRWIAPLSLELSSFKTALTRHGRGRAAADARFLLEWLEQTPISAKHLTAEEAGAGGLESLMQSVTSSLRKRNAVRLQGHISDIVKNDSVAREMLTGNIHLDRGADEISRIMNVNISRNLAGVNLTGATGELMRTMGEFDASGGLRAYEQLAGRGSKIKFTEIPEMIARGAARAVTSTGKVFSEVSKAATTASNILGSLGRSVIRHHKAIGLGFAGSLALSAALSSPKDTIGPGARLIPNAKINMTRGKAAGRMRPETLMPGGQNLGQPTAPNLMRNQVVRIDTRSPSRQTHVRARTNYMVNTPGIAGQLAGMGSNVSVNLRDNRSTLHPHDIANRLL